MAGSARVENPLVRHLECQLELNSSAGMLYGIFRSNCDLFPRLMPQVINNVKKIIADVWLWTFVDDKCGTWKNSVEGNNETKTVTWTLVEGEVPQRLYKTLKVEYHFSMNEAEGCKAKAKLTYEMTDINVPAPYAYMEFIRELLVAAASNPPRH